MELCRPGIDASRHTLTISLPDETVTINGDAVRLTQVLVNLLNNAIKFTPQRGHIWLIAETAGEDTRSPNQVRIRIRDTGVGISTGTCCRRSSTCSCRATSRLSALAAGLGVGLTLVRNLVALHGGTVEVRSEGEGRGSEFTVSLPIDPDAQPEQKASDPAAPPKAMRPLRILIADDNEDGREMLVYLLTAEGHTVAEAADGRTAIETAADVSSRRRDSRHQHAGHERLQRGAGASQGSPRRPHSC